MFGADTSATGRFLTPSSSLPTANPSPSNHTPFRQEALLFKLGYHEG